MAYDDYQRLRITVADGICRATVDNPPINLLDINLIRELARFAQQVGDDDDGTRGHRGFGRPGLLHGARGHHPDPAAAHRRHVATRRDLPRSTRLGTPSAPCRRRPSPSSRASPAVAAANWPRLRHALRRARQSAAGATGGSARHQPRRRRNPTPARLVGRGPRPGGHPRLRRHRRGHRRGVGLRQSGSAARRIAPVRRHAGRAHRVLPAGRRGRGQARGGRRDGDPTTGLRIEDQLFRETLASPAAASACRRSSTTVARPARSNSATSRSDSNGQRKLAAASSRISARSAGTMKPASIAESSAAVKRSRYSAAPPG